MDKYIARDAVLDVLAEVHDTVEGDAEDAIHKVWERVKALPSADVEQPKWIIVKSRPMDEEERKEWSEKLGYDIDYKEAVIYTSQLPDDGQEVLICGTYGNVRVDTFYDDPDWGCYFEDNGDMDGIVAWMPLPEPPKEVPHD